MQILMDERLSILKQYAREKFGLTRNARILIMLVSEEEHDKLKRMYAQRLGLAEKTNSLVEEKGRHPVHLSQDFFPGFAMVFAVMKEVNMKRPLLLTIIKDLWKIPKIDKYKYIILMRKDKFEEYGKRKFSLKGDISSVNVGELGYSYLLLHEFLHIVERELDIDIYTGDILQDQSITASALKQLPQSYLSKMIKHI